MPDLQETIRDALDLFHQPGEDSNERYERLAKTFYDETGLMAPGKSVPVEMAASQPGLDEREEAFDSWMGERIRAARDAVESDLIANLEDGDADGA